MFRSFAILLGLVAALLGDQPAFAQTLYGVSSDGVRVCPATLEDFEPPDFSSPDCESITANDIDPQGRTIWVALNINLPPDFVDRPEPSGLFVFATASTEAFFNETRLGMNGRVGTDRANEIPGRIDSVFFVPPEAMRNGSNRVVLRMSSHHGHLHFQNPIHAIFMGNYSGPSELSARNYWPSLVNLGVFVLAVFVFGVMALRGERREASTILTLFSLFMAAQLIAETSRGMVGYAYPLHDLRLFAIVGFATLSSLIFLAYSLKRFSGLGVALRWGLVGGVGVIVSIVIVLTPSYDPKAMLGIFVPVVFSIFGFAWWAFKRKPAAWLFLLGALGLSVTLFQFENGFLDTHVFYAGSIFLILLFFEQAQMLIRVRRQIATTTAQVERLEMALQQARQRDNPAELQLTSAGKVERLSTTAIAHLAAAGDYVEIHFGEGKSGLYTASLNELEAKLPDTFLRVHRSHIVNTAFVITLTRDANGVGTLALSTGTSIPVSRRIMPRVRSVLLADS